MHKKKILLVDDDHDIISLFEAILSNNGYQVITAINKREGFEKLNTDFPNLVILDVMMDEEHEGLDMSREIKKIHPELPIIALMEIGGIAKVNFEIADINHEWLPIDDFIEKPVNPNHLLTTIKNFLTKGT